MGLRSEELLGQIDILDLLLLGSFDALSGSLVLVLALEDHPVVVVVFLLVFFQPGHHFVAVIIPPVWVRLSLNLVPALIEEMDPLILAIFSLFVFLNVAFLIRSFDSQPIGFLSPPIVKS